MLKGLLCSVALIGFVAASSAYAENAAQADCTDANFMNTNTAIAKMADGDNKTMAMKEMDMAKESRSRAQSVNCVTHLNKAIDLAKGK